MQASETSTTALHPGRARSRASRATRDTLARRRRHHRGRRARPADGRARHRRPRHRLAEGADAAARPGVPRALRARLAGGRERAQRRASTSTSSASATTSAKNTTAWTPAISLDQRPRTPRCGMMFAEGLANVFARHDAARARDARRARRRSACGCVAPDAPEPGDDRHLSCRTASTGASSSATCATRSASRSPADRTS